MEFNKIFQALTHLSICRDASLVFLKGDKSSQNITFLLDKYQCEVYSATGNHHLKCNMEILEN